MLENAASCEANVHRINRRLGTPERNVNGGRCGYCGKVHQPRRCPAWGKTCGLCTRKNHFASCCTNANVYEVSTPYSGAAQQQQAANDWEEGFAIFTVCIDSVSGQREWIVNGFLAGPPARLKEDKGAQVNILYAHFIKLCFGKLILRP
ncbi:hypothetical protein HPB49_007004 [Dermacentor silvarum]|uniref:Uncharacterized protein n=1 Tax=Dermacentor silvarum TaxID=543639 RepID=A0ACB8CVW8_DERSI|nr:hypothetical protein HPB49_007004 [Dermacentor silvarum]